MKSCQSSLPTEALVLQEALLLLLLRKSLALPNQAKSSLPYLMYQYTASLPILSFTSPLTSFLTIA